MRSHPRQERSQDNPHVVPALVADGDASIEAAARDGGVTNVTSVDHETKWMPICTIVRGT